MIKQKLETVFRCIERERMRDIPICNPALQVEAVGFSEWEDYYLGVMVTPWFMNLMLLPVSSDDFENVNEGCKQVHIFPSGRYEFISAREPGLGPYQVCSLLSPMFDFKDHQTAIEMAKIVLDEMMETRNRDTISTHEKTIIKIWRGEQDVEKEDIENKEVTEKIQITDVQTLESSLEQKLTTPISRREFLSGGRSRTGVHSRGD